MGANDPAGQIEHVLEATIAKDPASHCTGQKLEPYIEALFIRKDRRGARQRLAVLTDWDVWPAGQGVQPAAPALENVFSGHCVHEVDESALNVPTAQVLHSPLSMYWPDKQETPVHVDEP